MLIGFVTLQLYNQLLCEYYKKNGSFDIPVSYVTDNGVALGKWIRHQRDFFEKGKLSEERIEKLRNIGFVLEKSDPWEEKFQLAKAYFEEYGNLNVPAQYVVNGVWLSKWLNEQKLIAEGKRKKKHTAEQLEKLQSIGMQYGRIRSDEIWYERYNQAKAYYEENGNLDIPKGYISYGFGLGLWLDRQKKQYRNSKLSDEYIKLLEYIGIDWKENNQIGHLYETGFQHLEKFISEYGVEALTSNCVCDDGYNLGRWIANCKAKFRKGKLAEKYAVRFEKLGIRLGKEQ